MNILNILKNIKKHKKINIKKLPSQGFFYKKDFNLFITKASSEDISIYESNFIKDVGSMIFKIKKIVKKNTKYSKEYSYKDLKSVDIIYIFLEIVKFTTNKTISLSYYNERRKEERNIEFNSDNFNYFKINFDLVEKYNKKERLFEINGFKYSLPTIGVEDCLSSFLISKIKEEDSSKYNEYFFDFTHFVGHKNHLTFNEIDNLIKIFNFDIEDKEFEKIKEILNIFKPIQIYSLIDEGEKVSINNKIDLSTIWK